MAFLCWAWPDLMPSLPPREGNMRSSRSLEAHLLDAAGRDFKGGDLAALVAHDMGKLSWLDPASRRHDLDGVWIEAGEGPRFASADQRPAHLELAVFDLPDRA